MIASEPLLRALFEAAPIGAAVVDLGSGHIVEANPRFAEITGRTLPELTGLAWSDVANAADDSRAGPAFAELSAGKRAAFQYPTRYAREDGSAVWFAVTAMPLDPAGGPRGRYAFVEDASERRHSDQARAAIHAEIWRRDGEARALAILDHGVVGFVKTSLDGSIIRANARFCEIAGRGPESLLGTPLRGLPLFEDRLVLQAHLDELLKGAPPCTMQQRYQHADGRIVWTSATIDLIRDAHGAPLQVALVVVDTSRHVHAEEQRRHSDEGLRVAIEGARLGTLHWDLLTRRLALSETGRRYLGLTPDERIDTEVVLSRIHAEDREHVRNGIRQAIRECGPFDVECRAAWPDGTTHWLELSGRASPEGTGDATRVEGVIADIDARKASESGLLRYAQELAARAEQVQVLNLQLAQRAVDAETATRAKQAFLSNLNHEFRTPLNHVMGALQVLADAELGDESRRWAELGLQSAQSLLHLIEQSVDAAALETGAYALASVDFSPSTVLREVAFLCAHRAQAKGLALTTDAGSVPDRVRGDPMRLAQALLNYLDNAIKFTTRGFIQLSARVIADEGENLLLRFEVRDTGIGITREMQETLFHPFARADMSTTRAIGGLGIGLSNAREIAKLMGGLVGVDSWPGHGSTFWLTARFRRSVQ